MQSQHFQTTTNYEILESQKKYVSCEEIEINLTFLRNVEGCD